MLEVGYLHHVTTKPFQNWASYVLGPHRQLYTPIYTHDPRRQDYEVRVLVAILQPRTTMYSIGLEQHFLWPAFRVRVGPRPPLGRTACSLGALAELSLYGPSCICSVDKHQTWGPPLMDRW